MGKREPELNQHKTSITSSKEIKHAIININKRIFKNQNKDLLGRNKFFRRYRNREKSQHVLKTWCNLLWTMINKVSKHQAYKNNKRINQAFCSKSSNRYSLLSQPATKSQNQTINRCKKRTLNKNEIMISVMCSTTKIKFFLSHYLHKNYGIKTKNNISMGNSVHYHQ